MHWRMMLIMISLAVCDSSAQCRNLTLLGFVENDIANHDCMDGVYDIMNTCIAPDGRFLYVVGTSHTLEDLVFCNIVSWFSRSQETGMLSLGGVLRDESVDSLHLEGVNSASTSPDGKFLYVSARYDHGITWFAVDSMNGSLSYEGQARNGIEGISGLENPQWIVHEPDGKHIFVCASGTISWWLRDALSGMVSLQGHLADDVSRQIGIIGSPVQAVLSANGRNLYLASMGDSSVSRLFWSDSSLVHVAKVKLPAMPTRIAIDNSGQWLYVSMFDYDTLVWIRCDTIQSGLTIAGKLPRPQHPGVPQTGSWKNFLRVSPVGRVLYAGCDVNAAIASFALDPETGRPVLCGSIAARGTTNGASTIYTSIVSSPDGRHLYCAIPDDLFAVASDTSSAVRFHTRARQRVAQIRSPTAVVDIRGRHLPAFARPHGVFLSTSSRGKPVLRKLFLR